MKEKDVLEDFDELTGHVDPRLILGLEKDFRELQKRYYKKGVPSDIFINYAIVYYMKYACDLSKDKAHTIKFLSILLYSVYEFMDIESHQK